jgi:GNAT superfamily N-acetyltransferase
VSRAVALEQDTGAHEGWFYWLEPSPSSLPHKSTGSTGTRTAASPRGDAGAADSEACKEEVPGPGGGAGRWCTGGRCGLVSWALEDESGGVGLVYTVEEWRGKGLARWCLARVLERLHGQWWQHRRVAVPFCIVADADGAGLNLVRDFGLERSTALYQLLAGGDEMLAPRHPRNLPTVKVAAHSTSPAYLPPWPQRSMFNSLMDSPLLMSPRMRYEYRVLHDSNKGRRGEALQTLLASPHMRQALLRLIRTLTPISCGMPGCRRCAPAAAEGNASDSAWADVFKSEAAKKIEASDRVCAALRKRLEARAAGGGDTGDSSWDDVLSDAKPARGRGRNAVDEGGEDCEESSSSLDTPTPSQV